MGVGEGGANISQGRMYYCCRSPGFSFLYVFAHTCTCRTSKEAGLTQEQLLDKVSTTQCLHMQYICVSMSSRVCLRLGGQRGRGTLPSPPPTHLPIPHWKLHAPPPSLHPSHAVDKLPCYQSLAQCRDLSVARVSG